MLLPAEQTGHDGAPGAVLRRFDPVPRSFAPGKDETVDAGLQ